MHKKPSQEELDALLPGYTRPEGLYEFTSKLPFLGSVRCNVDRLVAGSWEEVVLDYEVGASGIADGAWFKATFKFYSDWALFQTSKPTAANYLTAEYQAGPLRKGQSPATVQSLKVRFDQKGHERPFQKAVIVDTVDGYLNPGDHIIIRLGDRRFGGPGTRVQTFVEKGFCFRCYVDPLGTSRFGAVPGDIEFDIVPGPPSSLRLLGPRLAQSGREVSPRLCTEDRWGNVCWKTEATALLTASRAGRQVFEKVVPLNDDGWAVASVDGLPTEAGELCLRTTLPSHPSVPALESFITFEKDLKVPLFYGDLHVHSDDTVGTNDTRYNLTYGRDVAGLDVVGYTANDFQITAERWAQAVALCRELSKDGEFVCFPGTEWCGNSAAGGDHNVVFIGEDPPRFPLGRDGGVVRSFEWNENMSGDEIQPGAWPIDLLYAAYADDPENHLFMPHVGGRRCNLDWHHPGLERLAEVGSAWGHFPWLYEEVMQRGYKLGVSANSDEHRGRCGGGVPGTAVFGTRGGVTGIIADTLSRKSIGRALRARHTFATTGEHLVALARCGSAMQGDELKQKGKARIDYRFLGDVGWDEIAAYDHQGIIMRRNLQEEAGFSSTKIRLRWGGARIRDRYRWASWNGTITVVNGTVHSFRGLGFEHGEETCFRQGPTAIGFRSDTYGDADTIEMQVSNIDNCVFKVEGTLGGYVKLGDPLAGRPFVHCPTFSWEISGKELLSLGTSRRELGGTDLFLALERLSETPMLREVSGTLEVAPENGPHGHRPVFLVGRQVDDSKAWTSALFIEFE